MKYAVIGAAGQLGRDLVPRLNGEVISLGRDRADLTQADPMRATLEELRPDVVINCAAYNFVDKAEAEPEVAFATNAHGVRSLALVCRALDCTLVHFSTDYVYGLDEERSKPYGETDAPGPVSVYGVSKLAGEQFVRSICPKHFVIRTCGLYGVWGSGGKGGNFVETMLRVAGQGKPLRVVGDQTLTPSYTADVAGGTIALLATQMYGLYHLTNTGSCSWFEFARTIFEKAGVKAELSPTTSAAYIQPARRPGYSVLSTGKSTGLGLAEPRPWQAALDAYLIERQSKK